MHANTHELLEHYHKRYYRKEKYTLRTESLSKCNYGQRDIKNNRFSSIFDKNRT